MNIAQLKSFLNVVEIPLFKSEQSPEWLSGWINHTRTMVVVHQDTLTKIGEGSEFQLNTAIKASQGTAEEYTCHTLVIRKATADVTL